MSIDETDEAADQIRTSIGRIPAKLPPDLADRAYRQTRKRRTTRRVLVTAGTAAVAAAVATVVLAPRTAPATENTAYVVSHVTQALNALPTGTILFSRMTWDGSLSATVTDTWATNSQVRVKVYTRNGQLASDTGHVITQTAITSVRVDYAHKTWSRSTTLSTTPPSTLSFACATVSAEVLIFHAPNQMVAWLRAAVSCGALKAEGTAVVDGVKAIKLTKVTDIDKNAAVTYFVNPKTYLPIHLTVVFPHGAALQDDFQWLPTIAANLAKLSLPAAPQGFNHVSQ